jgi:hypothetical protein
MGPTALLPLRRKAFYGFYHPQNPSSSAGFEHANLGSSDKHANHYTTEGDFESFHPYLNLRLSHKGVVILMDHSS